MITKLKADISDRPELFYFGGCIPESEICQKINNLWKEIGGGDMFETETILSPIDESDLGEDIESINNYHYSKGLSKDFLIFHIGLGGLSAFSIKDERYCIIDSNDYKCGEWYKSLDEWYENHIRNSYMDKYNLK